MENEAGVEEKERNALNSKSKERRAFAPWYWGGQEDKEIWRKRVSITIMTFKTAQGREKDKPSSKVGKREKNNKKKERDPENSRNGRYFKLWQGGGPKNDDLSPYRQ